MQLKTIMTFFAANKEISLEQLITKMLDQQRS